MKGTCVMNGRREGERESERGMDTQHVLGGSEKQSEVMISFKSYSSAS